MLNHKPCSKCPESGPRPRMTGIKTTGMGSRCRVLIVGDYPGWQDIRHRQPFGGDSRTVLTHTCLDRCMGLPMGADGPTGWAAVNLIQCPVPDALLDEKREKELRELYTSCRRHHLVGILETLNPELVIFCGNGVYQKSIWGDWFDLETMHGIPYRQSWGRWKGLAMAAYHPKVGAADGGMMIHSNEDFVTAGAILRGEYTPPVDEWEGREDYRILETESDVAETLEAGWVWWQDRAKSIGGDGIQGIPYGHHPYYIACDTEHTPGDIPFNLSYSLIPGTGYIIMADRPDLIAILDAVANPLTGKSPHWLYHYALHDIPVLRKMGMPDQLARPFSDTMMAAFHRQNLHQGLKSLAFRLCGMAMEDFEDVVTPYSMPLAMAYLARIADPLRFGLDDPRYMTKPTKTKPGYKNPWNQPLAPRQTSIDRKATRILKAAAEKGTDIWETWGNLPKDERDWIQEQVSARFPLKSIAHVHSHPTGLSRFIRYAARDADATLRVWMRLQELPTPWSRFGLGTGEPVPEPEPEAPVE